MKILHTSDWHLGRTLYGKKRYAEFERFFEWLLQTLEKEKVDLLLVAGDIFDTTTPSNRAQQLYYQFLCRAAKSVCRHIVIVGGNHDSSTFLDAPKELLANLNVHVVGSPSENRENDLLTLYDPNGKLEVLVCAVPYLRDRDLRTYTADEDPGEKDQKALEGITRHYKELADMAQAKRQAEGRYIPIIATGHLFAAGGHLREDEGIRELYVGSLLRVGANCFPSCLDYVALGHLHIPQNIAGLDKIRYSGSPLSTSPSESGREKSVTLAELSEKNLRIKAVPVPIFQRIERLSGDMEKLSRQLMEIRSQGNLWLEIVYEGEEWIPNLRERLDSLTAGTEIEILRIRNPKALQAVLRSEKAEKELDELTPSQIFVRCMEARKVPDEERPGLMSTYTEVLDLYKSTDLRAE